MRRLVVTALIVVGVLFLGLAVYYWKTPAGSLPHYFPGYQMGSIHKHLKHGFAALILAVGCGIIAWFMTGKKAATTSENTPKE